MGRLSFADLGKRPLFFPALALAAGALTNPETVGVAPLFLAASGLGAMAVAIRARRTGSHLLLLACFFALGAGLATRQSELQVPPGLLGEHVQLEGEVDDVRPSSTTSSITLRVERVVGREAPSRFRAALTSSARTDVLVGERIRLSTVLRRMPRVGNPGEWDGSEAARRRGVVFRGSFDARRVAPLSSRAPWRAWVERTRRELESATRTACSDSDAIALYLTLAAGLRAELQPALEKDFASSGLAHVLSVSGLHVAALALLLLRLLRLAASKALARWRQIEPRRLAAPAAIPLVWSYVVFTGSQPPAVRSAIMASAMLLGLSLWRRADALNSLACAAIAMICWDAASVADLSVRLSFGAVFALIVLAPAIRDALPLRPPDPHRPGRWSYVLQKARESGVQTLCASGAAILLSLPWVATAFHRVSAIGLVSNVICLPLCGVLTLLAAGGAAVFVVSPFAAVPVLKLGVLTSALLNWLVRGFAAIPGAAIAVPSLSGALSLAYVCGLLIFALARSKLRWLAFFAPLALVLAWSQQIDEPGLSVTFLSVGHGDAIVLRSRGHTAIVDGGGVPQGTDTGRRFVVPFLEELGVRRLDLAVLSHPHPDHALGLATTLEEIPARRVWLGAGSGHGELIQKILDAAKDADVEWVEAGSRRFWLGEALITVIGPPKDRALLRSVNDRSVVLHVQHGSISLLLTGDLEAPGERALAPLPRADLLKAPHHGSKTSSTPETIARVSPRFVVFSVGLDNRFHFPSAEVVERYARVARTFRTDTDGAITFESDGRSLRPLTFRAGEPALLEGVDSEQQLSVHDSRGH